MGPIPDVLLGPLGALALAIAVAWALWKNHVAADTRDRRSHLAELEHERANTSEWKTLATTLIPRIDGFAGSLEKVAGSVDKLVQASERTESHRAALFENAIAELTRRLS